MTREIFVVFGCLWLLFSGFAAIIWALSGGPAEAGLYGLFALPCLFAMATQLPRAKS